MSDVRDVNQIARECADLRDELATAKQQLSEARGLAAMWSNWRDAVSVKLDEAGIDEDDLPDAEALMQKIKDEVWEQGYATALMELRDHWVEAIGPWAERQGVELS